MQLRFLYTLHAIIVGVALQDFIGQLHDFSVITLATDI